MANSVKRPALALVSAAACALLLAGCGEGGTPATPSALPAADTAATTSATASATVSATPGAPAEATTTPSADGTGQQVADPDPDTFLSITDVRVGAQDGFDRVVIELDGQGGRPGYDVRYVPAAYADGSGEAVDVDGAAILEVRVSGWGYPFDTGATEYSGPRTIDGPGDAVAQVRLSTAFEGVAQVFVGVAGQERPFTVTRLDGPTRIIVDVAH